MTKEEYREKALALYRAKEKEVKRTIVNNLKSFYNFVDAEYVTGTPVDKVI